MNSTATSVPAPAAAVGSPADKAGIALAIGLAGTALTGVGLFVSNTRSVAFSWLMAVGFWTLIVVGMLMLVMLQYACDASWAIVIRRQYEHWLAAMKWLLLLFVPLLILSFWIKPGSVWLWMNPHAIVPGTNDIVAHDLHYLKKISYLNPYFFMVRALVFYGIWIWLAHVMRRNSFRQDVDGNPRWTYSSRFWSGFGLPFGGLAITFAFIDWFKSLEYHWFSTIYGVYCFATGMRGAISIGVLIMIWLYRRGDYRGLLNNNHLHSAGQLMLTFTIFWAYIAFSQYFLIWMANEPEETSYFVIREYHNWYWIGMSLLFFYFFVPFCYLLSYRNKINLGRARFIAWWILVMMFIDVVFNTLPALRNAAGHPVPFFSPMIIWDVTAMAGVTGICAWAYLRSFGRTKLMPVRDPRIIECLTHHETTA